MQSVTDPVCKNLFEHPGRFSGTFECPWSQKRGCLLQLQEVMTV